MARQKYSPKRIAELRKQGKAVELKAEGWSYEDIAIQLGYKGKSGAQAAVAAGMKQAVTVPANEYREQQDMRLDIALRAIMPQVQDGDLKAVDTLIKIEARRAALWGIDGGGANDPESEEATRKKIKQPQMADEAAGQILRLLAETGALAGVMPDDMEGGMFFLPDGSLAGDDSDIPEMEGDGVIESMVENFRAVHLSEGVDVLMRDDDDY